MKSSNPPKNHHYIPQFLLTQWTVNGRLNRYTQPSPGKIICHNKPTKATGFEQRLYEIPMCLASSAQDVETRVMQPIDDAAATTHKMLLTETGFNNLTVKHRIAWVTFILSLTLRTPDNFSAYLRTFNTIDLSNTQHRELQESYEKTKLPNDPDNYEDYLTAAHPEEMQQGAFYAFKYSIENKPLIHYITNMLWFVLEIPSGSFLLSDEPLLMSNGIKYSNGHIVIPISQTKLFLATNNMLTYLQIKNLNEELTRRVNMQIVSGARLFVASRDANNNEFIRKYFYKQPRKSIIQYAEEHFSSGRTKS
ncbi:MAG: DUF4238 domain-containing protein [Gluconobacter sp.]|uniref:DUF4238 domain-containing protein n=1 Tax=Gluconobacter sp. TaxID=1876758 RepID=UPI0039E93210